MNKVSELRSMLGGNLPWNKARLFCAYMLIALLIVRIVNLSEIAVAFSYR